MSLKFAENDGDATVKATTTADGTDTHGVRTNPSIPNLRALALMRASHHLRN